MERTRSTLALLLAALGAGCASQAERAPRLHYVGSSTIANFLRDAEPLWGRASLLLETEPESAGGERAILEGRADLAGVAGELRPQTRSAGLKVTRIGRDAIAVLVHPANPVEELTCDQLREVFSGRVTNWRELGGPDLAIVPLVVGPDSQTRNVFRAAVLGSEEYRGCEVVRPDGAMLERVAAEAGAIGQLSLSFLSSGSAPKILRIDGKQPARDEPHYAITRPLYLLWWPSRESVRDFMAWVESAEGRAVLQQRFATGAGQ